MSLAKRTGFADPRLVADRPFAVTDPEIAGSRCVRTATPSRSLISLFRVIDGGTVEQDRQRLLVVLSGAGVAILPARLAEPEIAVGRLERWGKLVERHVEVWVLCPSKRLRSAKVTAFVAALTRAYAR